MHWEASYWVSIDTPRPSHIAIVVLTTMPFIQHFQNVETS